MMHRARVWPWLSAGLFVAALAGLARSAAGGEVRNLFAEDTGFETGTQNFRYYRSEEPIRVVSGDAAEGETSLEIDGRVSWAQGRWDYVVRKDADYVVSFSARRVEGGGAVDFAFIDVADWKMSGRASFRLTDDWRRYSCRIRTDRAGRALFPAFLPRDGTVFRIDAIQLTEGTEPVPYRPAESFSAYPTVGPGEVVHTPATPRLDVSLHNAGIATETFTLRLRLAGRMREIPFILKTGGATTVAVDLPEAAAPGYYPADVEIVDAGGATVKRAAAPFVVTGAFPEAAAPGFFGMQESPLPSGFLRRIGVTRVRTNLRGWKDFEPREGEWRDAELGRPAGLWWHPTMNHEFVGNRVPAWALKPDGIKADPAKMARFLDRLFPRLRESGADFVDFVNEPDLTIGRKLPDGAEYYAELLRAAAPVARKHGLKLMVGVSGVRSGFFEKVLKEAGDGFEIAGPHPYASPRIFAADGRYVASPEKGDFVGTLRHYAELARHHNKELAIGELGYSLEETIPFDDPAAHRHADYLSRMFLIARSYPDCRYLMWFLGLDRWEAGPYCYGVWRTENGIRPLPAVAAYAQAAHEIDGARDVAWELDDDIKILRFRKNGRTAYAVWNAGDDTEPLPFAAPSDAAPRSVYGAPLAAPAVTGSPIYLSENERKETLAALKALVEARPPLAIRGYLRDRGTLKLHVRNRAFADWKGELEVAPFFRSGTLTIPRQSAETVTVPFTGEPPARFRVAARRADGKVFARDIEIPPMTGVRRLAVGDLEAVPLLDAPDLIGQSSRADVFPPDPSIPWSGPEDLSHRTLLGWDEAFLYIFSAVRDDFHVNPHPDRESWRGDSLQVGIDSWNDADGQPAYAADDHEFTFALGKKPWTHQGPPTRPTPGEAVGARQHITRSEETKTTTYRLAIPLRLLSPMKLREGTVFGLALCFNDEDPGERRYHMAFGGGIAEAKRPALFRKMVLEGTP